MAEKKSTKKPVKAATRKKKTDTKKRVTFKFHAPDANSVFVAGTFNGWDPTARSLKKDKAGIWSAVMNLAPGLYEYRYVKDGDWVDDPECRERRPNEHGSENCVLRV